MVTKLISNEVLHASGVQFGTSGARGLASQFTSDVCAAFTHAFIASIRRGFIFNKVAVAIDNRPSSPAMAQAVIQALTDAGVGVVYYGVVPTPALAFSAMQDNMPCIMVTGSHIPFDRNGIKFYRPDGEISKEDEEAILTEEVSFNAINEQLPELEVSFQATERYQARYTDLFDTDFLKEKRIGIYEHSSAGRDIYQRLFESLGAEVVSLGRTDEFVPIDTEAVAESDKEKARTWSKKYKLDFIFSTDGDGDRPLVADEDGEWLRGDILGLLCSKALKVEALSVPVSCNTIIAKSSEFKAVSLTQIGSPYVIAEFENLARKYKTTAGFEANGGYLLGSNIEVNDKVLKALPTRDAVLPILMLLSLVKQKNTTIKELVAALPKRYTHSDRIQNFATEKSLAIIARGTDDPEELLASLNLTDVNVANVNYTDGLRIALSDSTIVHFRPSGNAPELRCYAEASDFETAKALVDNTLSAFVQI
ncbi:phosphomannomutase [Vibrio sp. ER1A]|uniref:phosphomannomutase n=1 Tax=Vibrio sp. ER1A TaxID=1517681 RepID=UPI0004DD6D7A|nr:phosphomannomutase [Vibrio sp. ER1A]KFA95183.1 phosphomannomutase [Vibrio sp. ER1A]